MMLLRRHWLTAGAVLVTVPALLYLAAPWWQAQATRRTGLRTNQMSLAAAASQTAPASSPGIDMIFSTPVSLQIPRLGLQLAVKPGYYDAARKTWTLNRSDAFWMQPPLPDMTLPTPVIYGHNIPDVFRPLEGVARDEPLWITLQDGRRLLFSYVGDRAVAPTDDTPLRADTPNSILLMTCTGAHFQERRVMHFAYVGERAQSDINGPGQGVVL